MPLNEYKRKRDLTRSREPAGDEERDREARRGQPRFFCVQKHLASTLHYDFRLEHNGVLLSWAVPKGPSLDPAVKRLAMHVEDHPIDYGKFEGVIPEGYGAGLVMLWDRGTWTPQTDDVDKALAKGDLKFTLDGYKLKGSWVLVRTGGYARARSSAPAWLLIKHRDEWSGDLDITEFAPLSVKNGQDFHEILAEDDPGVWRSGRAASPGETGAMLRQIIERAATLKAERAEEASRVKPVPAARQTPRAPAGKTKTKATRADRPSKPSRARTRR